MSGTKLKKKAPRRQYGKADDGSKIVSVTQVIGLLDKPGLLSWAAGIAATSCAQMLLRDGLAESEAIERSRKAWATTRDAAADAGRIAHAMCEELVTGGDPEDAIDAFAPVEVQDRARAAFARFAEWWPTSGYALHLAEEQLVDRATGYGGTLDLVLRTPGGRLVIADIKTGKSVYDEVTIQLAAYASLMQSQRGETVSSGLVIHAPVDGPLTAIEVGALKLEAGARIFEALLVVAKHKPVIKLVKSDTKNNTNDTNDDAAAAA